MAQPFGSSMFSRQLLDMVSLGHVKDHSTVLKFGDNDDVGTTEEDVWVAGGTLVYPTVAAVASVVSGDADDTAAGAGAQTVTVSGLDSNWDAVSETVDMDGITPVLTTQTFIRINYLEVATAGASGANEGAVTASVGGNVQATVEPGEGSNHDCHYSVPDGYTLYIREATTWQAKDVSCEVGLRFRANGGPWISPGHFSSYRNQVTASVHYGVVVPERGDIRFVASTTAGSAAQFVYWIGLLRKN